METTPPEQAGGAVQGYSRADVDQYLTAAAAELQRLEGAVQTARERQRRAEEAAMQSGQSAEAIRSTLDGLQRELAGRRTEVERHVEAVIAQAHEDAAAILRDARTRAHAILENRPTAASEAVVPMPAPAPPAPDPAPVAPDVAPAPFSFESALSTLTVAEPEAPPAPDIDLTLEDAFWQAPAAGTYPGNGHPANDHSGVNGDAKNGSANGHEADGDVRATTGFTTLLRRALPSRPTDPVEAAEDDAFFDFLRGALDDSEPLGPRGDEESQA
jgi:DivIVA protein